MNSVSHPHTWRPRFTLRALLTLTLLLALYLGWRTSAQRGERLLAEQQERLVYAERELERARDDLKDLRRPMQDSSRVLFAAKFAGASLPGVTIASPSNAFQRTSFEGCNFKDATFQGDTAAFQLARFDGAKLTGATLVGGHAAFQGATFVDADLTDAILKGGAASFQTASFENAKLLRARVTGSFQRANINGARFEGADLSAIQADDLASCYFREARATTRRRSFLPALNPRKNSGGALPNEYPIS